MDWSLYQCGRSGHITYAPDEPHLREHLHGTTASAELWQCLRCGTYVAGEPQGTGPVDGAPAVKRGKQIRGDLILKLFAIERMLRVIIFGAAAFGILRFAGSRISLSQAINRDIPIIRTLFRQLGLNLNHALLDKLQSLLHISASNLRLLALAVTGLAVVSAIEAFALWQARRWGEYFAMIATSLGLPFEIYELSKAVTVTKVVLFVLNILLVVYLVYSRRLFGARGGKHAYEARLRASSIFDEAEKAVAAIEAAASSAEGAMTGAPARTSAGGTGQARASGQVPAAGPASAGVTVPMVSGAAAGNQPTTTPRNQDPGGS
jgi:uncharacterized membrane protein (DUF2068 family)